MASAWTNLWNKWTGKGLTDAQKEVNAFNANEAQKARLFEAQMSNTAQQRQMADMVAAGVNPALMMANGSNGASTPSGEAAQAGSDPTGGLSFSDLIGTLSMPMQIVQGIKDIQDINASINLKHAQEGLVGAQTEEATARAESLRLNNKWIDQLNEDRHKMNDLSMDFTREQMKTLEKNREVADADIALKIKQAETEEKRKELVEAQKITEIMRTREIAELLPYEKALKAAQAANQRAAAKLAGMQVLIEQRKLDGGYYDSLIEEAEGRARVTLSAAEREELRQSIRDGSIVNFEGLKSDSDSAIAKVWNKMVEASENGMSFGLQVTADVLDYAGGTVGAIINTAGK